MTLQTATKNLLSKLVGTEVSQKTQQNIGFLGFCPSVLMSLGGCLLTLNNTLPIHNKDIRTEGIFILFFLGFLTKSSVRGVWDRRWTEVFIARSTR